MLIRPYKPADERRLITLWESCKLIVPWNNPHLDIERKLKVNPELFLVGLIQDEIVAAVMGGYEGHRGWVNYLAVTPERRDQGLGAEIMAVIEEKLKAMGCPKINLQIRSANFGAREFYRKIGYVQDDIINMGKPLTTDPEFHEDG